MIIIDFDPVFIGEICVEGLMIISKKGEKQLLCLGRSLLSKSKIVLIDEATSSIDLDTETKIHKIIQENFRDVTVLGTHHQNIITDAVFHGLSGVRDQKLFLLMQKSNSTSTFKLSKFRQYNGC